MIITIYMPYMYMDIVLNTLKSFTYLPICLQCVQFTFTDVYVSTRRVDMNNLLKTDWETHWSRQGGLEKASKTVIQQVPDEDGSSRLKVDVNEESLEDFLEEVRWYFSVSSLSQLCFVCVCVFIYVTR